MLNPKLCQYENENIIIASNLKKNTFKKIKEFLFEYNFENVAGSNIINLDKKSKKVDSKDL